jgi:small basic protein
MENWIGIGVWILLGAAIGLAMKAVVKVPRERSGHSLLLAVFGALAAVIGGMLGVGIFEFDRPLALSVGGVGGAVAFAILITWVYRWGVRGLT